MFCVWAPVSGSTARTALSLQLLPFISVHLYTMLIALAHSRVTAVDYWWTCNLIYQHCWEHCNAALFAYKWQISKPHTFVHASSVSFRQFHNLQTRSHATPTWHIYKILYKRAQPDVLFQSIDVAKLTCTSKTLHVRTFTAFSGLTIVLVGITVTVDISLTLHLHTRWHKTSRCTQTPVTRRVRGVLPLPT